MISIIADQDWFRIQVKDNGSGFEICKERLKGNGLANIKNRMMTIGGKVGTRTRKGDGTEVLLMIPVNDEPKPIARKF